MHHILLCQIVSASTAMDQMQLHSGQDWGRRPTRLETRMVLSHPCGYPWNVLLSTVCGKSQKQHQGDSKLGAHKAGKAMDFVHSAQHEAQPPSIMPLQPLTEKHVLLGMCWPAP